MSARSASAFTSCLLWGQIRAFRRDFSARMKSKQEMPMEQVFSFLFRLIEEYVQHTTACWCYPMVLTCSRSFVCRHEAVSARLDRLTAVHNLRTHPTTNAGRIEKTARDHLSVSLLAEAQIVFTTLSGSALGSSCVVWVLLRFCLARLSLTVLFCARFLQTRCSTFSKKKAGNSKSL